ncbi:MAG: YlbF family regulator [Bacilli bacterium]|nr:YlbF family regulator [Bacilli bacterium]
MNKEIENKVDNIINYIKNTDSYKNYLKSKELLNNREDLKELIQDIKKLQKNIIKNPKNKVNLQKEIACKVKILENDFLYNEYNNNLSEINNMLAILENKLNKYFEDIFN